MRQITVKLSIVSRSLVVVVGLAACLSLAACPDPVQGSYADPSGSTKIDLKAGGRATVTFMNQPKDCEYKVDKKVVSLDCRDGNPPLPLRISDDGTTLIMPQGSMIPNLKKK
jgi:hypothetical protein